MKPKLLLASAIASIVLFACGKKQNEDITEGVNKAGSVETAVSVEHADSTHDVLVTKHIVWRNFTEYKTIVYRDTIPALGNTQETAENDEGDTKNVNLKKDYEIFITVK